MDQETKGVIMGLAQLTGELAARVRALETVVTEDQPAAAAALQRASRAPAGNVKALLSWFDSSPLQADFAGKFSAMIATLRTGL